MIVIFNNKVQSWTYNNMEQSTPSPKPKRNPREGKRGGALNFL